MSRSLPWTPEELERLLDLHKGDSVYYMSDGIRPVQRFKEQGNALTPKMTAALREMQKTLNEAQGADARKLLVRVSALLGEEKSVLPEAKETWADAALADVAKLPEAEQTAWKKLFAQAQSADGAKPTAAWSREAKAAIAAVGDEAFRNSVVRWFGLVTMPAMITTHTVYNGRTYDQQHSSGSDRNIGLLKGLAWMCADQTGTEVARALAKLIEAGLKKTARSRPLGRPRCQCRNLGVGLKWIAARRWGN